MIPNEKDIKITELKNIQCYLTINATNCREQYINMLNNKLKLYNLVPIPIKKYKNEKQLVKTIKKLNSKNSNLENFISEYYDCKHNNILSDNLKNIEIILVEKNGNYHISENYNENGNDIRKIEFSINHILNVDYLTCDLSVQGSQYTCDKFCSMDDTPKLDLIGKGLLWFTLLEGFLFLVGILIYLLLYLRFILK